MRMFDRFRAEFERRGMPAPTRLLVAYLLLIIGVAVIGMKGALALLRSGLFDTLMVLTSGLFFMILILISGHRCMCSVMNRLNRAPAIHPVFSASETLLTWTYTREEWDR